MLAVLAQRLAYAAGACGDDGARAAAMGTQQQRIPVARELDPAEAIRHLHEIPVVLRNDRAGQAQPDRAFFGLPGVNVRDMKRPLDCLRDVTPGLLHTLSQRRRPRVREAQYLTISPRQTGASSRSAAVDADDVTNGRSVMRRHAEQCAACGIVTSIIPVSQLV